MFQIVSALCRQVVKDGASKGSVLQMERLYDSLRENDRESEAKIIKRLITRANSNKAIEQSKVEVSRANYVFGQELTKNSKIPVDPDTGAQLAEVLFGEELKSIDKPVLPEELEKGVNQLINQWDNIEKLEKFGVKPSLSCLLFGLPGTGKTHLALYIAKSLGLPVVLARLDGLVSSLLGTSARNISSLFEFVSQHKCILLLDEFDAVAKARNDNHEVGEIKRIVNTLLQCIDKRSSYGMTIAITNHEVLLDPAVWRRFDMRINVPKPNEEARFNIIDYYLSPLELTDDQKKFLVCLSDNYTGSDIKNMLNSFKRHMALNNHDVCFIDMVSDFLTIHAGSHSTLASRVLDKSSDRLVQYMNKTLGFTQKEIGRLLGFHPSKVSRMVNL